MLAEMIRTFAGAVGATGGSSDGRFRTTQQGSVSDDSSEGMEWLVEGPNPAVPVPSPVPSF
jgi:hypothetical protein